jgi:hypothetical protein
MLSLLSLLALAVSINLTTLPSLMQSTEALRSLLLLETTPLWMEKAN